MSPSNAFAGRVNPSLSLPAERNPFGTNVAIPQLTCDVTLVGKGVMPMNVGVDNAVGTQAYSFY